MSKKCALVIGHKKSSPGAYNKNANLYEFTFNDDLARSIETKAEEADGVEVIRVYRRTYATLPGDINDLNPDFVISLHCNAFNTKASGTETLYYHRSTKSKELADRVQAKLLAALGLADRGVLSKTSEDRGGNLLKNTNAPCVIAEPFFIDNDSDLAKAQANLDALAQAYADAIVEQAGATVGA